MEYQRVLKIWSGSKDTPEAVALDHKQSIELKQEGMRKSAENRKENLCWARMIAVTIAHSDPHRKCDIDRVQRQCEKIDIDLGNSAGSVFNNGLWTRIGYKPSARKSSHGHIISVWKLK